MPDRADQRFLQELLARLVPAVANDSTATAHLVPFIEQVFPGYAASAHHRLIAENLEAVEVGRITRLMIVCPPRHGKSELASVNFPAWFLGRNPDRRVIACAHTASLAYRFSRQARAKFTHPNFPFDVRLASGVAAVQQWELEGHRGGYMAAGVNGPITGQGANLLLIDDPVKSADDAASEIRRQSAWDWYQGTAYTRLEQDGAIVIIGTRWHQDDLLGRLLQAQEMGGDRWSVLHLPALALDAAADHLGREFGDPLWTEKYDVDALDQIRRVIGEYQFTAQYQGMPSTREASILTPDSWGWYDSPDEHYRRTVAFCDTAFKTSQRSDFSVVSIWGERVDGTGYDVLDVWRDRVDFPALEEVCERLRAGRFRPSHWIVEDKASGQSLIQVLAKRRFPVESYQPGTRDKLERVHAVSGYVRAGIVRLPRRASWTDTFITEHADFPSGAHDDQVATTAMALHWFEVSPVKRPTPTIFTVRKVKGRW